MDHINKNYSFEDTGCFYSMVPGLCLIILPVGVASLFCSASLTVSPPPRHVGPSGLLTLHGQLFQRLYLGFQWVCRRSFMA